MIRGYSMSNAKRESYQTIKTFIIALILALMIRMFFFSPIIVEGPSMQPTLLDRDRMIVNKFIYYIKEPERFDIVVFHASKHKDFIKRVIGLPGEHVMVQDNALYIDGEQVDEPFIATSNQENFKLEMLSGNYSTIPKGYVLVLGDNRNNSTDSRKLGLIAIDDIVFELIDALHTKSSQNPMLQDIIKDKLRLTILMKKDLADQIATEKWLKYFQTTNNQTIAVDCNDHKDIQKVIQAAKNLGTHVAKRRLRALILGIPNVGKSTLINRLAHKRIAKIGNRPGVTRGQQWIKVGQDFELLDTPGILWPKFKDQEVGLKLAALGTIKDHLLPLQDVAAFVLTYLHEHCTSLLYERFCMEEMYEMCDVFTMISKRRRGLDIVVSVNFDQLANIILKGLRSGKLGRIT